MRNGREVYCVVTDAEGHSVNSEIAVMRFEIPEDWEGPVITVQPGNWTGAEGELPTVSFEAAGGSDLRYQWYYRDAGKENFSLSSDKDDCYDSYPLTAGRARRELYCVVTDKYGLTAATDVVTMDYALPADYAELTVLAEPDNWRGVMGELPAVRFEVTGTDLRYQWYYRDAGKERWLRSSETDDCYDSYPLSLSRAGRELYCVVTDPYGRSVTSGTVTMDFAVPEGWTGPSVLAQPQSWTGAMGEYPAVTFAVEGEGLTYQWYYRDAGEEKWHKSSETDDCYDGYPLSAIRNGRALYCVVTDQYGFTVVSEIAVMSEGEPALPEPTSEPTSEPALPLEEAAPEAETDAALPEQYEDTEESGEPEAEREPDENVGFKDE